MQAPYGTDGSSVSWLDVVELAKTRPQDFVLNSDRLCQFWLKQCHVQVSEDDYRLILSGAPERMIPNQPISEDETSEMGTIEILEQRLALLIKKADLVAGRGRQLNYHLKGRKAAINSRRSNSQLPDQPGTPQGSASFQPINNTPQTNGEARNLHLDLLRQFMSDDKRPGTSQTRMKPIRTASDSPHPVAHYQQPVQEMARRQSHPHNSTNDDGTGGPLRPIMTAKVERLNRGEPIWPPCDRCRRLSIPCTKHLTACSGCTKKHAKCGWKDVSPEEAAYLNQLPDTPVILSNGAGGSNGLGQAQAAPAARHDAGSDSGMKELGVPPSISPPSYPGPRAGSQDRSTSVPPSRHGERIPTTEENMLSQMAAAAAAAANVNDAQ